jgi:hypothetical protein
MIEINKKNNNDNFYTSCIDLSNKLKEYVKKNKQNNENNINYYQIKNKNYNLLNYIKNYDQYDINEIICINAKYLEKCHLTYSTFNFFNNDIINELDELNKVK